MFRSLILAAAVSGFTSLAVTASAGPMPEAAASLIAGPASQPIEINHRDRAMIRASVETFIWGLSHREANPVWAIAPESMQTRLKTKQTALAFFSRVHPQLANARTATFDGVRMVGNVPVAEFYIKDKAGRQLLALFGIARRTDGAWNIAFCRIFAAPGILI